jgi:hypothetical protein
MFKRALCKKKHRRFPTIPTLRQSVSQRGGGRVKEKKMHHFFKTVCLPPGLAIAAHLEIAVDLGEANLGGVLEGAVGLAPRPHQAVITKPTLRPRSSPPSSTTNASEAPMLPPTTRPSPN